MKSALVGACRAGEFETVAALLSGWRASDGKVPGRLEAIYHLARHGNLALLEQLLESHHEPSTFATQDAFGRAMVAGTRQGHVDVVRRLLKCEGQDVDWRDEGGRTLLWWACREGRESVVKMLMEMGADFSIRAFPDKSGGGFRSAKEAAEGDVPAKQEAALPLDEALRQGHAACAAVIKAAMQTMENFVEAMNDDDLAEVHRLLDSETGRSLVKARSWKDGRGRTLLMKAAIQGSVEVARLLLERGAVVDAAEMVTVPDAGEEATAVFGADHVLQPPSAEHGATALYLASGYGKEEMVDLLLKHGANPARRVVVIPPWFRPKPTTIGHQKCSVGGALVTACFGNHTRIVRRLLQREAAYGKRTLIAALMKAVHGTTDLETCRATVEALLDRHPEILSFPDEELVDGAQEHIVVYNVRFSRWRLLKMLLSMGIGSSLRRRDWERALRLMLVNGVRDRESDYKLREAEGLQLILDRFEGPVAMVDAGKKDVWGRLLLRACAEGEVQTARVLLLATGGGARTGVDVPVPLLQRAVVLACRRGKVDLVRLMLDLCPPMDELDWTGAGDSSNSPDEVMTPLLAACQKGCLPVVKLLVERGHVTPRQLEMRDGEGRTPLLVASRGWEGSALVSLLLRLKADVTATDLIGRNALMHACAHENGRAVEVLLERPEVIERLDVTDLEGCTALRLAQLDGEPDIMLQLMLRGACSTGARLQQATSGLSDSSSDSSRPSTFETPESNVDELLEMVEKALQAMEGGDTAAASEALRDFDDYRDGNEQAFKKPRLASAVNCKAGERRWNIVMAAAARNEATFLQWCMEKAGADPSIVDGLHGRTALHFACESGHMDATKVLLESGGQAALLDQQDRHGLTPLALATQNGHDELATILRRQGGATPTQPPMQPTIEPEGTCPADQPELSASTVSRQPAAWALSPLVVAARQADLAAVQQLLPTATRCMAEADREGLPRAAVEAAVVGGCVEVLRLALLLDGEPTSRRVEVEGDEALLTKAVLWDRVAVAAELLGRGAKLCLSEECETDDQAKSGSTVGLLQTLSREGRRDMLKVLLEGGARESLDNVDRSGLTPLETACRWGHVETARLLLEYSSDRTIKTSCLIQAVTGEWEEMLTALLSWREDFPLADQDTLQATLLTAFSIYSEGVTWHDVSEASPFLQGDSYRMIKRLLMELNGQPKPALDGAVPALDSMDDVLRRAAVAGDLEMVRLLVEAGATLDQPDLWDGDTPLLNVLRYGEKQMVECLLSLERPLGLNHRGKGGQTAMIVAASRGNIPILDCVSREYPCMAIKDKKKMTALAWAARNGHAGAVRWLLDRHRELLEVPDRRQRTPLWWACYEGHEEVARLLLLAGASLYQPASANRAFTRHAVFMRHEDQDYNGETPLQIAEREGHLEWRKKIEALIRSMDKLHDSISSGDLPALRKLLCKQDASARSFLLNAPHHKNGETPLTLAVRNGQHAVAEMLLKQIHIEVNHVDRHAHTPLLLASKQCDVELVRLLVEHGADPVCSPSPTPHTALFEAVRSGRHAVIGPMFDAWIGRGRDLLLETVEGRGGLLWAACFCGHEKVVEELLVQGGREGSLECISEAVVRVARRRGHGTCAAMVERFRDTRRYTLLKARLLHDSTQPSARRPPCLSHRAVGSPMPRLDVQALPLHAPGCQSREVEERAAEACGSRKRSRAEAGEEDGRLVSAVAVYVTMELKADLLVELLDMMPMERAVDGEGEDSDDETSDEEQDEDEMDDGDDGDQSDDEEDADDEDDDAFFFENF